MKIVEHEYFDFMQSITRSMADEYERLQRYAKRDTGTSGDQSEEYWANFLRNWLPATYEVVTKGQILPFRGIPTNQVDIIVLRPDYPKHLRHQKMYFAGGVVAVFECKTTLRQRDLAKIVQHAAQVKNTSPIRSGSPYLELQQPIIYGVLAHSSDISNTEDFEYTLIKNLHKHTVKNVKHPRELIDMLCIADAATFVLDKTVSVGPYSETDALEEFQEFDDQGGITTTYFSHTDKISSLEIQGHVLGTLIFDITHRLAYENVMLREFATYLELSGSFASIGVPILWNKNVLSETTLQTLMERGYIEESWSEWQKSF